MSRDSAPAAANGVPKSVEDVMYSDIGITSLLNRLKQSIASARDFAAFLKKRSSLEEEQATGLKRLARAQLDTIRKSDARGGSYAAQLAEVLHVHERMADNGMQFALSLHQMHEDLSELSNSMERGRKTWKHEGYDAEKKAADLESAMQKAKARYDGLAEDYDRARTGDTKGSRRIGLKGPKSAEQHESDLLRKLQAADTDYEERVRLAKAQRQTLVNEQRPKAVLALKELCRECDSGLTLQLQKFATFNEKLLLGNGLAVSPLTGDNSTQRSLRDVILEIDNDKDLHQHLGGLAGRIPPRLSEINYEKHPTLAPKTQQPTDRSMSTSGPAQLPPIVQQPTLNVNTGSNSQPGSTSSRYNTQQAPGPLVAPSQSQAYDHGPASGFRKPSLEQYQAPPQTQHDQSTHSPPQAHSRDTYNAPPYPTYSSDHQASSGYAPQQNTGSTAAPTRQFTGSQAPTSPPQHHPKLPALRPVFGVSLDELFDRDQSAVPMIVIQCILAVDTFGLDVEGIYRLSGTSSHVNMLRDQFDHDGGATIDFRNPANFYQDVNSVATLLKQFFRDLPDPLFTYAGYSSFINAARIEDENARRDALHQSINDLPDPNYATLRALVLHMHRVMQHESRNRMGTSNLALCFA